MGESLSAIELNDAYRIGIDIVDEQHAFLIELYNELVARIDRGETAALLEVAVEKLFSYADYHFASEERVMEEMGFPELARHRAQHESFVRTLAELMAEGHPDNNEALLSVARFISRWVRGHILVSDKAISEYQQAMATAGR